MSCGRRARRGGLQRGDLDMTASRPSARLVGAVRPVSSSTAPPGPRSTPPRPTRWRPSWSTGGGAATLAAACAAAAPGWSRVSTDYVFAGDGPPLRRGRRTAPRTAYGRTKLAGEQAVRAAAPGPATWCAPPGCTARTDPTSSGRCGLDGPSTVRRCVDDQLGQPTWAADLAEQIVALASASPRPASTTPPARARRPGSGWPRGLPALGADPAG